MLRLYDKFPKGQGERRNNLIVPRVITIMQKCVEHNIQTAFIEKLHFNDLYVLILSLDISKMRQALKEKQRQKEKQRGINVVDVNPGDAVKFLKGGGG